MVSNEQLGHDGDGISERLGLMRSYRTREEREIKLARFGLTGELARTPCAPWKKVLVSVAPKDKHNFPKAKPRFGTDFIKCLKRIFSKFGNHCGFMISPQRTSYEWPGGPLSR